ncbi:MAG: Spi family protease inhibitor, partial [Kiritimatiellae bacterium]|nr:Spi family protease inhibitor [Kiritimatiellia bacterium]
MKRILPLFALLPSALLAAEVSPNAAARAAKAWVDRGYAMGKLPAGRTVAGVDEVEDPATGARLLVAKFDGGGFVVLSADDLVDPVLAFSETGDGIDPDDNDPFWFLLRRDI